MSIWGVAEYWGEALDLLHEAAQCDQTPFEFAYNWLQNKHPHQSAEWLKKTARSMAEACNDAIATERERLLVELSGIAAEDVKRWFEDVGLRYSRIVDEKAMEHASRSGPWLELHFRDGVVYRRSVDNDCWEKV